METMIPVGSKLWNQYALRAGLVFAQNPVKPDHEQAEYMSIFLNIICILDLRN
jgi:hypothetical protein